MKISNVAFVILFLLLGGCSSDKIVVTNATEYIANAIVSDLSEIDIAAEKINGALVDDVQSFNVVVPDESYSEALAIAKPYLYEMYLADQADEFANKTEGDLKESILYSEYTSRKLKNLLLGIESVVAANVSVNSSLPSVENEYSDSSTVVVSITTSIDPALIEEKINKLIYKAIPSVNPENVSIGYFELSK